MAVHEEIDEIQKQIDDHLKNAGKRKRAKASGKSTAKKTTTKAESAKTEEKKSAPAKAATPAKPAADDGTHAIEVKVKKPAKTRATEPTDQPASNSNGATKAPAEESKEKSQIISHSGKTIKPLSESESAEKAETAQEESASEPQPTKTEPALSEPEPKDETQAQPAAEAPAEPTSTETPLKTEATESKDGGKPKEVQQQNPKTFDTKEYNLPIKATRHHVRRGVPTSVTVLIIILVIAAVGVAAIDMELVDIGVDLPFDIL